MIHRLRLVSMVCLLCCGVALASSSACDPQVSQEPKASTDGGEPNGGDKSPVEQAPPKATIRASGPEKTLDPAKRGPYTVGVTTLRLTDPDRLHPDTQKPRSVVIEIWYPAQDDAAKNAPKADYDVSVDAPDAVKKKLKEIGLPVPKMAQDAYRDAKPLLKEGPYPVVLFSHGSGGIRFQSIFQTVHLASHGYVVISPDHEGNTLYDLFLDPNAQDITKLLKAAADRPIDMKFAMDAVKKRVETEGDLLHKLAKFDKIGITGHSFGGLTSILVTRTFTNLAVIIPQAPHTSFTRTMGVTHEHLAKIPAMVLAAKLDNTLDYQKEQKSFFDRLITDIYHEADRHLVAFTRGGHFTFSNICELDLKKFADKLGFGNAASILNDGCAEHNTPIQEAHQLINHYATALLNVLLRKSEGSTTYLKQLDSKEIEYVYKARP